jgi:hypothetical protein
MMNSENQSGSHPWATSGVLLVRVGQWTCVAFAVVFVVGAIQAGMNVIQTAALGIVALFLLGLVGVLELLAVNPIRRRWSA